MKRHAHNLAILLRITFGVIWLIDSAFKFGSQIPATILAMIQNSIQGDWLVPWYTFWYKLLSVDTQAWIYFVGVCEVLLGLVLVLGFMRKIALSLGMLLSFFIWSVAEGFGGPYNATSTDIGASIIYILVFFALMIFSAMYGADKFSLDYWIEKRLSWWSKIAEFK